MISVACAIIRNEDEEVLVVQRGECTDNPLKWEFPGGKVEDNESEEECIIREIKEELALEIVIRERLSSVEHDYGVKKIKLIPFVCDTLDELPLLNEHIAYQWLSPEELREVDFSEADIVVADNFIKSTGYGGQSRSYVAVAQDDDVTDEEFRSMISSTMGAKEVEWIAASAIENPEILRKLLDYSFCSDRKLAFHSSWALTKVCDRYPQLVDPYLNKIADSLQNTDNESVLRSFLRILSFSDLDKLTSRQQGILVDQCFNALRSGLSSIAIKAYSMEIIYRLALKYPDLVHELSATIRMLSGEGSAGIVARGRLILNKLTGMQAKPGSTQ